MSRIYKYNESSYYGGEGGDSRCSSMDEYLERDDMMQRTPPHMTDYFSQDPPQQVHKFPHNRPEKPDHRPIEIFQANHHHYQAPEVHRNKVHFTEHEKIVDIDRKGKHEVYEVETIDVEADGFIQQQHKSFESCATRRRS